MNEVLNRRHVLAKAEQLRLFHVKPTVNRVAERLSSSLGIPVASLARQRASCASNAPPGQPEPDHRHALRKTPIFPSHAARSGAYEATKGGEVQEELCTHSHSTREAEASSTPPIRGGP